MTELHEVTIQYINCPDPVESAARRQRVEESDERGDMVETTARIIANAQATRTAMLPHTTVIPSDSTIILGDPQITVPATHAKIRGRPPAKKKTISSYKEDSWSTPPPRR